MAGSGGVRSLSSQHFIAVAIVAGLAVTSTVSFTDIAFTIFSVPYIYFLSRITFPPKPSPSPPVFSGKENRILLIYVSIGALVGLLLPIVYILYSFVSGESTNLEAAAPHLFLLCGQIFFEGISFTNNFSLPARAAVPIFYNTKRLFTIANWIRYGFYRSGGTSGRVGLVLAMANMVFWGFNLLGFLLPVYLPRVLKLYYSDDEIAEKTS